MSDGDGNFPIDPLNQWEIEVLDKEMGHSGFQAVVSKPSAPVRRCPRDRLQNTQGHWRRMCPDFLFFHGDSENMGHPLSTPTATTSPTGFPSCGAWLSSPPATGESFHRIESVARMNDGTLRVPGPHRSVHPRGHRRGRGHPGSLPRWRSQRLLVYCLK